jgi:hypothetical protein
VRFAGNKGLGGSVRLQRRPRSGRDQMSPQTTPPDGNSHWNARSLTSETWLLLLHSARFRWCGWKAKLIHRPIKHQDGSITKALLVEVASHLRLITFGSAVQGGLDTANDLDLLVLKPELISRYSKQCGCRRPYVVC